MSILPFMRSKKKEVSLSALFNIEQIKRQKCFCNIVMCKICGGLFDPYKCEEKEVIRYPKRGDPWIDHQYCCIHCKDKQDVGRHSTIG